MDYLAGAFDSISFIKHVLIIPRILRHDLMLWLFCVCKMIEWSYNCCIILRYFFFVESSLMLDSLLHQHALIIFFLHNSCYVCFTFIWWLSCVFVNTWWLHHCNLAVWWLFWGYVIVKIKGVKWQECVDKGSFCLSLILRYSSTVTILFIELLLHGRRITLCFEFGKMTYKAVWTLQRFVKTCLRVFDHL